MWVLLEKAKEYAESLGADFVEVRGERQVRNIIRFNNDIVKTVQSTSLVGIGITVVIGKSRGHGFTSDLSDDAIKSAVKRAIDSAKVLNDIAEISAEPIEYKPKEYEGFKPTRNKDPEKIELEDKIALVTGAAGSIGSATVKRFAEEGATVILCDINEEGCKKVLNELKEKGGKGCPPCLFGVFQAGCRGFESRLPLQLA